MCICQHCGSVRKNINSWRNHERSCPSNVNRNYKNGMTGKIGSNQFKKAKELNLPIPVHVHKGQSIPGHPRTNEEKRNLSAHAIRRGLGGVTQSRWIKYNGKTLGSSYELKVAQSLDKNNIVWNTCSRISYIDPTGKKRTYTPDFYLKDYNIYLDPKNDFLINNINPRLGFSDRDKINLVEAQNNIKVFILNKEQLSWEYIRTLI